MESLLRTNRRQRTSAVTRLLTQWHRYKKLLLARWWILLVTLLLSLGIQWLWLRQRPPSFVSAGQMIVNVKLDIPSENTYSEELDNFYGTQVALMQSESVASLANQLLNEEYPGLHRVPVGVQVTVEPKTSIFDLQAVGEDPRYTKAYLQATMDGYINLKKDLLANASSVAKSNIRDELAQLSLKLQKSKEDLLNFQASNSVVLLQENGGNSAADYLANLNKQLAERQSELQLLKSLSLDEDLQLQQGAFVPAGSAPPVADPPGSQGAGTPSSNPAVAAGDNALPDNIPASLGGFENDYLQTKRQIVLLKAKRDELIKLAPKAFQLADLDEEITNQELTLEIYEEQSQEQLSSQKHMLEVQIQNLKDQVNEWNAKALDASKQLSVFEVLKENNQHLQTTYDQLLATLQTLDADKGTSQESVAILEPATLAAPIPPGTSKHMIMAALIGLVAGFGILMLLERLDDRPASFSELEVLFDQPVLAQFPLVKTIDKKNGAPILQLEDDRHMVVEAYQNLRSALIYKDTPANHPRRIVITSASARDGKSMVSANFAITLAQSGSRVLLVDADLRRGTLHRHFSVSGEPGLGDVFAQKCGWSEAVVPTSIPNLFLLPSGTCPRSPGSMFAMQAGKFLADIAGHYDYYLFDTAPIMAADDVSNLAPLVDGAIMVIRAGCTSARIAQAALDLLQLRKVNVIGLVFNAVQANGGEYYYYRDKNYYPGQPAS